jgi:hypothetical protein
VTAPPAVVGPAVPDVAAWGGAAGRRFGAARRRGVRPVRLLVIALALSVLGQLGRVPLLWAQGKDIPILVHELPLIAALAAAAFAAVRARSLRLDGVAVAALAFAAVGGISALLAVDTFRLSGYEFGVSLAYLVRWLAYFGIYVTVLNAATVDDARALWAVIERSVLAFAAFGLVQSAFLPGFAQKVFPSGGDAMPWDWQGHRLVSSILDPNYAGGLILLPLLVLLARVASGDRVPLWKPLVLTAALLATFSRSSVLGLFVGGAGDRGGARGERAPAQVRRGARAGRPAGRPGDRPARGRVQQVHGLRRLGPAAHRDVAARVDRGRGPSGARGRLQHVRVRAAALRVGHRRARRLRGRRGAAVHRRDDRRGGAGGVPRDARPRVAAFACALARRRGVAGRARDRVGGCGGDPRDRRAQLLREQPALAVHHGSDVGALGRGVPARAGARRRARVRPLHAPMGGVGRGGPAPREALGVPAAGR